MREFMPIMGCKELKQIPMAALLPHEKQAIKNHGQSLERLAQRGGINVSEAVAIIEGVCWKDTLREHNSLPRLQALLKKGDSRHD